MHFRGRFEFAVDPKGRVNIPSKFREILQKFKEELVVITNLDGCLLVYPYSEWLRIEERVARAPSMKVNISNFVRFFLGSASEVAIDKQGRILIPQSLREYAKFEKDVVIMGVGKRFEIWAKDAYFDNFKDSVEMMKDEKAREEIQNIIGI
jgi:MraZ protein